MRVNLLINGIRHNVPEEVRDEFYTKIVGQELIVVPEPTNPKNERAMAAMYAGAIVGHVSESTLPAAWECFNSKEQRRMRMRVCDVDRVMNSLKVCYDIPYRISKDKQRNLLAAWDWDYDGPMLKESEDMFVLDYNSELLLEDLTDGVEWNKEMECCFGKVLEKLHLDRSMEMQERLGKIMDALQSNNDYKRANMLQRAITHSNNDESREKTWKLIKMKSVSNTFKENVRLWYDKAKVKSSVRMLPEILKDGFRSPADVMGFLSYHCLPRKKYMQLLSFVAALDVVDEWMTSSKLYCNINGDLNVAGDMLTDYSTKINNKGKWE